MLIDIKPGNDLTVELPNETRLVIKCQETDCTVTHWSKEFTTSDGIKMRYVLKEFIQSELQVS
jgi:hypothetical protein